MKKRLENYINLTNKKYRLLAEISRLERTMAEYTPYISGNTTGVPSGVISSPTENAALNRLTFYEETQAEIDKKRTELNKVEAELHFLDEYINAVPDEQLRECFFLRYTQGVSWANIAIKWYYAPSSWWFIQKKVYDYINQHNS